MTASPPTPGATGEDDQRVGASAEGVVRPPVATTAATVPQTYDDACRQFSAAMRAIHPDLPDRLQSFLKQVALCGVRPTFDRSLTLAWEAPNGQAVNLAYISALGLIWTDVGVAKLGTPDPLDQKLGTPSENSQ